VAIQAAGLLLTVREPASGRQRDVLVRGSSGRTLGELSERLAAYLRLPARDAAGQPLVYGLRVERTGEQLRPNTTLARADVLDGDVLTLLPPAVGRGRPSWWDDAEAAPDERVVPLRRHRRPRGSG
jgi:hypothetical protein